MLYYCGRSWEDECYIFICSYLASGRPLLVNSSVFVGTAVPYATFGGAISFIITQSRLKRTFELTNAIKDMEYKHNFIVESCPQCDFRLAYVQL